jgi:hypothetical protein
MRRMAFGLACLLATATLGGCTPFFYGGVVLIGPGQENPPDAARADGSEQSEGDQ